MTRKVVIVIAVFWLVSVIGGMLWGYIEVVQQRHVSPGATAIQKLQDLYEARVFEEVLTECEHLETKPYCATYSAEILFIKWAANLRLGRMAEGRRIAEELLRRHPEHSVVANVHYTLAMDSLSVGDHMATIETLTMIEKRFPSSPVTAKARELRQRLAAIPAANG